MLTCKVACCINYLKNKWYVNIIMLHIDMIYLACKWQKFSTIIFNGNHRNNIFTCAGLIKVLLSIIYCWALLLRSGARVMDLQLLVILQVFLFEDLMSVVSICRIVSTYLVHHGYCGTAEAFSRSTGQSIEEEMSSIKHRQSKFYHNFCLSIHGLIFQLSFFC